MLKMKIVDISYDGKWKMDLASDWLETWDRLQFTTCIIVHFNFTVIILVHTMEMKFKLDFYAQLLDFGTLKNA